MNIVLRILQILLAMEWDSVIDNQITASMQIISSTTAR